MSVLIRLAKGTATARGILVGYTVHSTEHTQSKAKQSEASHESRDVVLACNHPETYLGLYTVEKWMGIIILAGLDKIVCMKNLASSRDTVPYLFTERLPNAWPGPSRTKQSIWPSTPAAVSKP